MFLIKDLVGTLIYIRDTQMFPVWKTTGNSSLLFCLLFSYQNECDINKNIFIISIKNYIKN